MVSEQGRERIEAERRVEVVEFIDFKKYSRDRRASQVFIRHLFLKERSVFLRFTTLQRWERSSFPLAFCTNANLDRRNTIKRRSRMLLDEI